MKRRSTALAGCLAAGCALLPAAARADIRIVEKTTALESVVTRWTAIKGDKRSIVTRAQTTGVLADAGARYGAHVEIARPDKELIWELDPQEKTFREVTFAQFSKILQRGIQGSRRPEEQILRSRYQTETTTIDVNPTGRTKRIAGYPAEEYLARVIVGVQNIERGTKGIVTFDQQIWLTKDTNLLKEVRPFEDAYTEQFGSSVTLQQAELMAGEWSDAFITHIRALGDRVRKEGGFPLSVTTEVTWEALAQSKDEKNNVVKQTAATTEVTDIQLATLPDTEFELPAGYINQDTNVAVAPKPGSPTMVAANTPPPVTMQAAVPAMPVTPPAMPVTPPVTPPVQSASAGMPNPATGNPAAPQPGVAAPPVVKPAPAVATAPVVTAAAIPPSVPAATSRAGMSYVERLRAGGGILARAGRSPIDASVEPQSAPLAPSVATNSLPVFSGLIGGGSAPSIVTIDEPDTMFPPEKKKKKRR